MSDCGHKSYQCAPAIVLQSAENSAHFAVMMPRWCTVCGQVVILKPEIERDGIPQATLAQLHA